MLTATTGGMTMGIDFKRHGRTCSGHPRTAVVAQVAGTPPAMTELAKDSSP
jgi:hypothetical protein